MGIGTPIDNIQEEIAIRLQELLDNNIITKSKRDNFLKEAKLDAQKVFATADKLEKKFNEEKEVKILEAENERQKQLKIKEEKLNEVVYAVCLENLSNGTGMLFNKDSVYRINRKMLQDLPDFFKESTQPIEIQDPCSNIEHDLIMFIGDKIKLDSDEAKQILWKPVNKITKKDVLRFIELIKKNTI